MSKLWDAYVINTDNGELLASGDFMYQTEEEALASARAMFEIINYDLGDHTLNLTYAVDCHDADEDQYWLDLEAEGYNEGDF